MVYGINQTNKQTKKNMKRTSIVLLFLVLWMVCYSCYGEKHCVITTTITTSTNDTWYPSLRAALYADCTHIQVQPGVYRGDANRGLQSESLLELQGMGDPWNIVFDVEFEDYFLYVQASRSPQRLILSNLTIQNSFSHRQGALSLYNYELLAHHVYFVNNLLRVQYMNAGGSALLLDGEATLRSELYECLFVNNSLWTATGCLGGLGTAVAVYNADLTVSHCGFMGNVQRMLLEEYDLRIMYSDYGSSSDRDSTTDEEEEEEEQENKSQSSMYGGGTLFFWGTGDKRIVVKHSNFIENDLESGAGGALMLWDVDAERAVIHGNWFVKNRAASGSVFALSFESLVPLDCAHNQYEDNTATWPDSSTLLLDKNVCLDLNMSQDNNK